MRLPVRDVLKLTHLTGQMGITSLDLTDASLIERSPADTWAWLDVYDRLQGPGFRIDEISYLLLHRFDPSFVLPLPDADIGISLIDLQSELRKLRP
jgi:hypothetical protein